MVVIRYMKNIEKRRSRRTMIFCACGHEA